MCLNGVEKIGTLKIYNLFTFILALILSSFLNVSFLATNSIFLKMLKQILQESFFFYFFFLFLSSMPLNLNQYRETVSSLNNCNISTWNFSNIWYSQSFQNCSIFIFFKVIFLCSSYLFNFQECLKFFILKFI